MSDVKETRVELIRQFEAMVAESGVTLAELTPRAALDILLRIVAEDPGEVTLDAHWGDVAHYGAPRMGFTFSLGRACPVGTLTLLFRYGPAEAFGEYRSWPWLWCAGPGEAEAFRAECAGWDALLAWGDRPAEALAIPESRDPWIDDFLDFHDCWGERNPEQPAVHMTEEEWLRSDDPGRMLRRLRQEWRAVDDLDWSIRRYLLACCRRIWPLLRDERSRWAVEAGERCPAGERISNVDWYAEGAAFRISEEPESAEVLAWCAEIGRIPTETLDDMLFIAPGVDRPSPRELLERAAYFVSSVVSYPGRPAYAIEDYRIFLSPSLLREMIPYACTQDG